MITDTLIKLVSHYESLHDGDLKQKGLQPKMCPAGFWTEGYGRLVRDDKGNMLKGVQNKSVAYKFAKIKTPEQALQALKEDLEDYEQRVDSLGLVLKQNEKDALISFSYNVGFNALKNSTLLKYIKSNAGAKNIDIAFRMFNRGGGKVLPGLVARRTSESLLYNCNELKFFN